MGKESPEKRWLKKGLQKISGDSTQTGPDKRGKRAAQNKSQNRGWKKKGCPENPLREPKRGTPPLFPGTGD